MSQDRQDGQKDELTRGHPDDGLGLLQVVLLSYNGKGERQRDGDRYAAIKFPQSYEDAMSSLQQSLGRYLEGGPEMIDSAEADKKDWDRVVQELQRTRKILAIRQRMASEAELNRLFYKGPVILTYEERIGGRTKWTDVQKTTHFGEVTYIDRPESFEAAIELIIRGAKGPDGHALAYDAIQEHENLDQVEFKFYYFVTEKGGAPSTGAWNEFPPDAYVDDEIWRAIVPKTRQILGYSLHPKT